MTQRVDDHTVLYERDVGIAPHQLYGETELNGVIQFAAGAERKDDVAVETELLDAFDARTHETPPEKHTECRRFRRILIRLFRELDAAIFRMNGNQQPAGSACRAHGQEQSVFLRLLHFVDLAADERPDLGKTSVQRETVHGHASYRPSSFSRFRSSKSR